MNSTNQIIFYDINHKKIIRKIYLKDIDNKKEGKCDI